MRCCIQSVNRLRLPATRSKDRNGIDELPPLLVIITNVSGATKGPTTKMNAWRLALALASALAAAAEAARTAVVLEAADIRDSHSQFFKLLERTRLIIT